MHKTVEQLLIECKAHTSAEKDLDLLDNGLTFDIECLEYRISNRKFSCRLCNNSLENENKYKSKSRAYNTIEKQKGSLI